MALREKASRPHLFVTYCAIGVLIGGIGSQHAGMLNTAAYIQGLFIWMGVILMLGYTWTRKPTWPETLKSKQFWFGIGLIAVGNILWLVLDSSGRQI